LRSAPLVHERRSIIESSIRKSRFTGSCGRQIFKLAVAFFVVAFFAVLQASAEDWSAYQHDTAHTGRSAASVNVPFLNIAWTSPTGYTSPSIVGNTVYATKGVEFVSGNTTPSISAFDLATGAIKWTFTGVTFSNASRASVAGGFVVFVGTPANSNPTNLTSLYVLDATTGNVVYTVPLITNFSFALMPVAVQDAGTGSLTAYCVSNNTVLAVSLGSTSGFMLWQEDGSIGGFGLPTIVENSIILAGPGQYYSFDRLTGAVNHFYTSNTFGGGGSTVAYDAGRKQFYVVDLYTDSGTRTLSAYRYTDNAHIDLIWQRTGEGVAEGSAAAIGPTGHVYTASSREIIEVDPDSGAILGRAAADFSGRMTPAISDGVLWAFSYSNSPPLQTYAFDLCTLQLIRKLPGSRGPLNTAYCSPGAISDNCFVLDAGSTSSFVVYTTTTNPVHLNSIASRLDHGAAGVFDLNLPLCGETGIECRKGGGAGNAFTLVFSFSNPLTFVGSATVAKGTASIITTGIDPADAHNYLVNLTGVSNAQVINVTLTDIRDSAGGRSNTFSASMGLLLGDTNSDGVVNVGDTIQVRLQAGNDITSSNFRMDVNTDGLFNVGDTAIVRAQSGTALPTQAESQPPKPLLKIGQPKSSESNNH
jgi:hypothetical protein